MLKGQQSGIIILGTKLQHCDMILHGLDSAFVHVDSIIHLFRFVYSLCRLLSLSIYLILMSRSNLNVDIWRTCRTLKHEVCARVRTLLVASSSTGKYGKIATGSGVGTGRSTHVKI